MEPSRKEEPQTQPVYLPEEHPWLEVSDDSLDESIRFSLDELRFA